MQRKPYMGNDANRPSDTAYRRSGSNARPATGQDPYRVRRDPSGRNYSASNGSRRPSPGRRPIQRRYASPRPPQKKKFKFGFVHFAVLTVVLFVAIFFGSTWLTIAANRSTYCENIYINDIHLDNYSREAGIQAVRDLADSRLNTVHTLYYGDSSWSFSAADFGGTMPVDDLVERAWNLGHVGSFFSRSTAINELKKVPVHFNAELTYDETLLDRFVDELYSAIYIAPVDAQVIIDIDRPHLATKSSDGRELDREYTRAQIISLVESGTGDTMLKVNVIEPSVSSDAVGGLDVIVRYETDTTFRGSNSTHNVRKALESFNGLAVHPGDTMDFNAIVGKRTKERGYVEAPEYAGNTTEYGYGGGVCQASTTLYGAILLSGMDVIDRYPHKMTVSYVDPSLDAAVNNDDKNFVFANNTDYTIYIFTDVTDERARVTIYGNKPKYEYKLQSKTLTQENQCTNKSYRADTEGKYAYYTNETELYLEGRPACTSEGWLVAYDWETGVEVSRKQLSYDIYASGTSIYWRGIHDPVTGVAMTPSPDYTGA